MMQEWKGEYHRFEWNDGLTNTYFEEILLESIIIVGCDSEITGDEFSWEVCVWVVKTSLE